MANLRPNQGSRNRSADDIAVLISVLEQITEVNEEIRRSATILKQSNVDQRRIAGLSDLAKHIADVNQKLKSLVEAAVTRGQRTNAQVSGSQSVRADLRTPAVHWSPITAAELEFADVILHEEQQQQQEESIVEITYTHKTSSNEVRRCPLVPHPKITPTGNGELNITITQVISADRFYCLVDADESAERKFSDLARNLQSFYSNSDNRQPLSCDSSLLNSCCALTGPDGYWHRGEVVELVTSSTGITSVVVLLLDLGYELLPQDPSALYVLMRKFCDLSRRSVVCCLAGIFPTGGDYGDISWSSTANEEFRKIAENRSFKAIMSNRSEPLELYVQFNDGTSATTINQSLVMQGYAVDV